MLTPFNSIRRKGGGNKQNLLRTTTIREFDGGWNVVDNDLNLSSKFAKILDNIRRDIDGSQAVRGGTRMIQKYQNMTAITGDLSDNPLTTLAAASTKVRVRHVAHGLIAGHTYTIGGVPSSVDGIPNTDFNKAHTIYEVEDVDNFIINTSTAASAGAVSGGGTDVTFSHNNQEMADDEVDCFEFQDRIVIVDRSGTIIETDDLGNSRVIWNASIAAATGYSTSGTNSLATVAAGTGRMRWTKVGHGLDVGAVVSFRGSTAIDGIPTGQINTTHTITAVVSADVVEFTTAGSATVGGVAGGGASIEYTLAPVDGWGATDLVSFTPARGKLVIQNGIDKPLLVDLSELRPCDYLVDESTGSNFNVPVGYYGLAMDQYFLIAGDLSSELTIHISAQGTIGTFVGDPAPNDATTVNLGSFLSSRSTEIRGLSRFRDKVVVILDDVTVFGTLGIYEDDVHVPDFSDIVQGIGGIASRALKHSGTDLLFADHVGIPSLKRSQFTDTTQPERVSILIDPEIQEAVLNLTTDSTTKRIFGMHNQRDNEYWLFVPNNDDIALTTETTCFVFKYVPALKIEAFARFTGWNWTCGCSSLHGRQFFMKDRKLYVYHATEDPIYADLVDDPDIADPDEGEAIDFVWEFPWADFNERMSIKKSRYIGFDTKGTGAFTCTMFVDNIYRDADDVLDPLLSMDFVGGDSPGFGGGEQNFGGGRRTSDERLWAWNAKFKIMKLRIEGSVREPLRFVAITLGYQLGSIRR